MHLNLGAHWGCTSLTIKEQAISARFELIPVELERGSGKVARNSELL